jgi:hypothetical protein
MPFFFEADTQYAALFTKWLTRDSGLDFKNASWRRQD